MVREHKRQDKTKYKISREMNPVENLAVLAWTVLKLFNLLARGGGGSKAPPGSEYDQGGHCKTALEQVIESVRFYCEVYNFIVLDTILKSRQLFNGDFIATFSEKKNCRFSELARIWKQFYRFCKAVRRDSSLKQTNKMYL